ncbi:motile sperm domain-containing protein 3 isoform X3 [Diceros bicornis minor]|uniref:motile sperm domain-containing protein 3 isoform X3 n=1 Tax=Diceros bicornis minor TaxID=77932 RepID=UPI0026EA2FA6|nr:motile sperm domain-containing protein 3 isoform X3 [Diceros bicornis minor]
MRRGAPQDQELVGPGAPGRGSRGAPPPSGPVVPVLVFPPDLVFRADQRSGPRQLLTLYNPTGAALRFRVLCTAPAKYRVFDSEGYVKPQSCIDIPPPTIGHQLLPPLLADGHHLCGLPAAAAPGRTRQPAAPNPARLPGTKVGGSLCLGPPHHGVPPHLSPLLNLHPPPGRDWTCNSHCVLIPCLNSCSLLPPSCPAPPTPNQKYPGICIHFPS